MDNKDLIQLLNFWDEFSNFSGIMLLQVFIFPFFNLKSELNWIYVFSDFLRNSTAHFLMKVIPLSVAADHLDFMSLNIIV